MSRLRGTRNEHPRAIWTREQDLVICRLYRQLGSRRTADVLTRQGVPRSRNAVATRARRLMRRPEPRGYTPLVDVHPYQHGERAIGAHYYTVTAARKAGTLKTMHTGTGPTHLVPTAWADEHAQHLADEAERERELRGWLTTRQLADAFGLTVEHVRNAMLPGRRLKVTHYLAGIRRERRPLRHRVEYLWCPEGARTAVREWKARPARKATVAR
jgi:hypothetical protein